MTNRKQLHHAAVVKVKESRRKAQINRERERERQFWPIGTSIENSTAENFKEASKVLASEGHLDQLSAGNADIPWSLDLRHPVGPEFDRAGSRCRNTDRRLRSSRRL